MPHRLCNSNVVCLQREKRHGAEERLNVECLTVAYLYMAENRNAGEDCNMSLSENFVLVNK